MLENCILLEPYQLNDQMVSYLISRNWWRDTNGLWHDKTQKCSYVCNMDVAISLQLMRDKFNKMPWYKRLWGKL